MQQETLVIIYKIKQRHIPEGPDMNGTIYCSEKLKSHVLTSIHETLY
jgi:hypothetical protein